MIKVVLNLNLLYIKSTNIGEQKSILWKGKNVFTGIYKTPINSIVLGKEDVNKDAVVDRKYHGGIDKACYLFSGDVYSRWKEKYPNLDWHFGMFGENLTVKGLDEREVFIGDQFCIGETLVEVSEPREPCFKLGIRFGTQKVLKDFINQPHCGVYVRVLKQGKVKPQDKVELFKRVQTDFSIARIFWLRNKATSEHKKEILKAIDLSWLAKSAKQGLAMRLAVID